MQIVAKISETSTTLAVLTPHILYVSGCLMIKFTFPRVFRYIAVYTYTTDFIAVWYPFYKTVLFLSGSTNTFSAIAQSAVKANTKKDNSTEDEKDETKTLGANFQNEAEVMNTPRYRTRSSTNTMNTPSSTLKRVSSKGNVADRWLNATSQSSSPSKQTSYPKDRTKKISSTIASKSASFTNNNSTTTSTTPAKKKNVQDTESEISNILKYWVVYALVCACAGALHQIPFVGSLLHIPSAAEISYEHEQDNEEQSNSYFFTSLFSFLSPLFLLELKLMFFVWLCLLPTYGKSSSSADTNKTPIKATSSWKRQQQEKKKKRFQTYFSPTEILYGYFSPIVLNITSMTEKHTSGSIGGFIESKLSSILDLAVLVRVISQKSKDILLKIFKESTTLLPACITLFMPSFFTYYGCLYVSSIVPAALSSSTESLLSPSVSSRKVVLKGTKEYKEAKQQRTYMLKYWVVFLLIKFSQEHIFCTILKWLPFSTHLLLLGWVYMNLPFLNGVTYIYEKLEYELVAFGILNKSLVLKDKKSKKDKDDNNMDENDENYYDVNKTLTAKLFHKISSSLPVAKDDEAEQKSNNNTESQPTSISGITNEGKDSVVGEGVVDTKSLNESSNNDEGIIHHIEDSSLEEPIPKKSTSFSPNNDKDTTEQKPSCNDKPKNKVVEAAVEMNETTDDEKSKADDRENLGDNEDDFVVLPEEMKERSNDEN